MARCARARRVPPRAAGLGRPRAWADVRPWRYAVPSLPRSAPGRARRPRHRQSRHGQAGDTDRVRTARRPADDHNGDAPALRFVTTAYTELLATATAPAR